MELIHHRVLVLVPRLFSLSLVPTVKNKNDHVQLERMENHAEAKVQHLECFLERIHHRVLVLALVLVRAIVLVFATQNTVLSNQPQVAMVLGRK